MSSMTTQANPFSTPVLKPERVVPFADRVVHQTFAGYGARLSFAWIALIALLGIFAPLLANSHPLILKTADGQIEFPFLRHLSSSDCTLMIGTLLAIVVYVLFRKSPMVTRWGIMVAMYALLAVPMWLLVHPPSTVVYERYRIAESEGKYAWVVRAPVPYSPSDRSRDVLANDPYPWRPSFGHVKHWMGTDQYGADVLSRMVHASRVALSIGFVSAGVAAVIGIFVGGVMGFSGGWVDLIGMRIVEIFAAIPVMYILLMIVAFISRDLYFIMFVIGAFSWVGIARLTRAEYLKARNMDFVHAARALGLPLWSIMFRHVLPSALAPVLVSITFAIAGGITAEATLSFLGLGAVDQPSWGDLLNQAVGSTGGFVWWLAVYPGAAIFFTVFSYNLIGQAMRDALDPKLKKRD